MGVDMLGTGLSANADYAKLEQILRMSLRRDTGSSPSLMRIKKGETFVADKARILFKKRYVVSQNHTVISGQNAGVIAFFSP